MFSENVRPKIVTAVLPLTLLAILALASCPGSLDLTPFHDASAGGDDATTEAGAEAGPCPDVPTQILAPQCAKAGCHVGTPPAGNLDLSVTGLATLPGKSDPACGGTFADPANPEKSVIYLKLPASPPCGARMPFGATPLSDSDQQCVLQWIKTVPAKGFVPDAASDAASE